MRAEQGASRRQWPSSSVSGATWIGRRNADRTGLEVVREAQAHGAGPGHGDTGAVENRVT